MPLDQTANFVRVNVEGTYTSSDTTIQLNSGEASEVPDPANGEYNLVWFDSKNSNSPSSDPEAEIVRVTGRDTNNDTITVQRGQEDTSAVAHDTSDAVYQLILSPTSKVIKDVDAANFETNSLTVAGNLVGLGGSTSVATGDLSDQNISSPSAGQTILYDASAGEFVNGFISAGTALGSTSGDGVFTLNVQEGNISHDNLSGYVANEHIDHSTVSVSAGTHLTGGGDLTASRTLNVDETGIDATNLDGSAGSVGQFLQTDGSNLTFSNPTDVDATSYKGNDIDSDGDGTVDKADDAETVQGNQPSELGNTVDQKTIVENSQGDIEVNGQNTLIIGDFETDLGGWTLTGNSFRAVANGAESTDGSVALNDATGDATFKNNYDLTNKNKLVFFWDGDGSTSNTFEVRLDGDVVFTKLNPFETPFRRVEIDISDKSGNQEIEFFLESGNGSNVYVDRIKLVEEGFKADLKTVDSEAGN